MKKISSKKILDTLEKIQSEGLWKQLDQRNMVVYTGEKGMEIIHDCMVEIALKPYIDTLLELFDLEIITESKHEALLAMIYAKDQESVELAKDLINIKCKENGNRIQIGGPQLHLDGRSEDKLDFSNNVSIKVQDSLRPGSSSFVVFEEPKKQEVVWSGARGDLGYLGRGVLAGYHPRIMVPRSERTRFDCLRYP